MLHRDVTFKLSRFRIRLLRFEDCIFVFTLRQSPNPAFGHKHMHSHRAREIGQEEEVNVTELGSRLYHSPNFHTDASQVVQSVNLCTDAADSSFHRISPMCHLSHLLPVVNTSASPWVFQPIPESAVITRFRRQLFTYSPCFL